MGTKESVLERIKQLTIYVDARGESGSSKKPIMDELNAISVDVINMKAYTSDELVKLCDSYHEVMEAALDFDDFETWRNRTGQDDVAQFDEYWQHFDNYTGTCDIDTFYEYDDANGSGLTTCEAFDEAYVGVYASVKDFAEAHYADERATVADVNNAIAGNIDWQGVWDSELTHSYLEINHDNGVVIFRNDV